MESIEKTQDTTKVDIQEAKNELKYYIGRVNSIIKKSSGLIRSLHEKN